MNPSAEWLAQWEADEAESARALMAEVNRLQADLDAFPDSPTLNALAQKDPTGRVISTAFPTGSVLPMAWRNGAPAWLIVKAERITANIGTRDTRGHLFRAIRLDAARRDLNRRLRPYLGRNALGTVTVRLPLNRPAPADNTTELSTTTGPVMLALLALLVDTDADPPPLDAPALAPLLRTGPPASPVVRPRQAAPVLAARRSERWTVSRAA